MPFRSTTALTLLAMLVLPTLWASPATADSMRCSGSLVRTGDRMFDVRRACGEPDVAVTLHSVATSAGLVPVEEEWQYNFGRQRLIRFLRFQNGRLTQIRSGGRGFLHSTGGSCSPSALQTGISQLELVARCGEPEVIETRVTGRSYQLTPGGVLFPVGIPAEEWFYTFDDTRFIRVVTVVNGRVVDVDQSRQR